MRGSRPAVAAALAGLFPGSPGRAGCCGGEGRARRRAGGVGGADEGGDVFGGLAGELGQHAGVGVGGDGDGGQAEGVLDDFHVVPGGEQEGGGAVAQVMQPDGGQAAR